jgi:ketosteroid isomerase-like protein
MSLMDAERAAAAAVFRQGVQAGLQDFLSDDVVFLFEGAPLVYGRGRAIQVLASQPSVTRLRVQRMPVLALVSRDGNFGATTGASVITALGQPPDSAARFGHYITVWRRTDSAAPWRIVAQLENGLMADAAFQAPAGFDTGPIPLIGGPARTLADADLAFARMAGDSTVGVAFGNFAAADATFPPGDGLMTVGPAAIRERMSTPARNQQLWRWHPVFAGATAGGDFGYTIGEATIAVSRAPDAQSFATKYLTVWQRQPDGSLKFVLDSGNGR